MKQNSSKLKEIFNKKRLTTKQIAKALHVSVSTVYNWKQGRLPSLEVDMLLEEKLHINVSEFDTKSSNKIKELFQLPGIKRFKLLRLSRGLSLSNLSKITGIGIKPLFNVEQGKSVNFSTLFTLADFYHIHIRQLTNRKFSLYQIYEATNNRSTKIRILRRLNKYSLEYISNKINHKSSVKALSEFENGKQKIPIQLIGDLVTIYNIPFKILLNFLDYKISGIRTANRKRLNGMHLKILRLTNHLTLRQVCRNTHNIINHSVLSSCENGHDAININALPYLANVYHVPLKLLMNELRLNVKSSKDANTSLLLKYEI